MIPSRFRSRLLSLFLLRATFVYEGRRGTLNGQPHTKQTPFIPPSERRERKPFDGIERGSVPAGLPTP